MGTVDLETWVSIGALIGTGLSLLIAILTTTRSLRTELKGDITGLRTELKGDITGLRTELKDEITGGFARVDARLTVLEQRTYELASRLPDRGGLVLPPSRR